MALKGIVIDPGHGGSDPGAVSNGIKEKDYNLLISKYMYNRFKELGVPVSITRKEDTTLSPSDRTKKIKSFYGDSKDVIVVSNFPYMPQTITPTRKIITAIKNL